jgi:hypothetical protein
MPGSSGAQPQAWVLTSNALHAAQPQSCSPHALLLSQDICGLGTTGHDVQMQASRYSCLQIFVVHLVCILHPLRQQCIDQSSSC